ncbi:MAG: hypothetical protein JWN80_2434 [Microbacteriaceae bacterium]|nr:hypothetical protein [Microbacteriaceae bacterium]
MSLPERLVEFVTALRGNGITAGTGETVDAGQVIEVLGLDDRERLREGLAAALLRGASQRAAFDAVFDIHFPAGAGAPESARDTDPELDVAELREQLTEALANGDQAGLGRLAGVTVDRFGRLGVVTDGWSGYMALERVQPQNLLSGALQLRGSDRSGTGGLGNRAEAQEIRGLIQEFRRMVQAEALRRSAEVRGRERMAANAVPKQLDRVDFLTANAQQLAELRRVVRPLARRLATRLAARRRRHSRGRIDIRKTLRRSMSTGGVPIEPAWEKPRPTRPELVLLCDVSGSVAGFSNFTMLLVQAMKSQFSKIRVFAFVNAIDEITDLIEDDDDLQRRIHAEAKITKGHSSSDYGRSLREFAVAYLDAITSRSAVIILGDARNNYGSPAIDSLAEIAARSRRTFWLNPERAASWGSGDSVALQYAEIVEMHECRTVEQLGQFVTRLLPV